MDKERFDALVAKADLTKAEYHAMFCRVGLKDGAPQSLKEIGVSLKTIYGRSVTRQCAHQILQKAEAKLAEAGDGISEKLGKMFPVLTVRKVVELDPESPRSIRRRVRSFLHNLGPRQAIQYGQIMAALEVPLPEARTKTADLLTEEQSIRAFCEDFGVWQFGARAKICNRCMRPLRVAEFYRLKNGRLPPYCKDCNTVICRERYRRVHNTRGREQKSASQVQETQSNSKTS